MFCPPLGHDAPAVANATDGSASTRAPNAIASARTLDQARPLLLFGIGNSPTSQTTVKRAAARQTVRSAYKRTGVDTLTRRAVKQAAKQAGCYHPAEMQGKPSLTVSQSLPAGQEAILDALDPCHATRAALLRDLGRAQEAAVAEQRARELTRNPAERSLIEE